MAVITKSKNRGTKVLFTILICLLIILYFITTKNDNEIRTKQKPSFITDDGGLYAHASMDKADLDAWQKWGEYSGVNSKKDCKYFFLPTSSDDNRVEIYNNFTESVTISDKTIQAKKSAIINYTDGEKIAVTIGEDSYNLCIYKSDAEASVFVNDCTGSYKDYNGIEVKTDLFYFLVRDKRNFVQGSKCTIVDKNGITNTTLKKIKGRGNSSWFNTDKKSFNITFNEQTVIGHTLGKKFSLISTPRDSTMLRNKIIYDLSNAVGLPYSPDMSYIDFYVNGIYRGCYTICEKVDMGKNALVSIKDNSEDMNSDFNFLVEVDAWNYYNDTYFVTDNGYHIVLKTPDLNDYNENDPNMYEKYNYIKNTYQKLDDALYKGTLEDLEKICDIESLATAYLIQEFGKNCDGGLTSTYFTYNAEEKKFYAAPIWDCDTMLGSLDIIKEGYTVSAANYKGYLTRYATFEGTLNPLGQPFQITGKTSDGKTYEEVCKSIWNEKFIPAINIILGKEESKGRLKSIDEYLESCQKAVYNNYIMWNTDAISPSYSSRLGRTYPNNYNGEIQYLKDWVEARMNWMTTEFTEPKSEEKQVSYYLTGHNFGGLGKILEDNKLAQNEDGSYSITKTFNANEVYEFTIIDSDKQYYKANYHDSTTMKYSTIDTISYNAHFTFEKDTELTITLDGDYFTISPTSGLGDVATPIPTNKKAVYFKNSVGWDEVYYYTSGGNTASTDWPGLPAEIVKQTQDGIKIYKAMIDEDNTTIIFNNGDKKEKTEDIKLEPGDNEIYIYEPDQYVIDKGTMVFSVQKSSG